MTTDRPTKALLALIALGLLLNALNPWIHPEPVAAQAPPADLPMMEVHLRNIDAALEAIGEDIGRIETAICHSSEAC